MAETRAIEVVGDYRTQSVATNTTGDALRELPPRDLDHRWNIVREDPPTAASLVQGDVVGHEPEDGRQCSRTPTNPGAGQLRDGMAVASQTSSRNGSIGA